jgi:hypothetical protein
MLRLGGPPKKVQVFLGKAALVADEIAQKSNYQ